MNGAGLSRIRITISTLHTTGGHSGHELVIMSNPAPVSQTEYDAFCTYLQGHIMNHAFV